MILRRWGEGSESPTSCLANVVRGIGERELLDIHRLALEIFLDGPRFAREDAVVINEQKASRHNFGKKAVQGHNHRFVEVGIQVEE